jgi:molybdopterin converting factor small subunit
MKVKVLLFAGAREALGRAEFELEVSEGAAIRDLAALPEFGALKPILPSSRFALNEEFSSEDAALSDGDVVAVIPPVSGG